MLIGSRVAIVSLLPFKKARRKPLLSCIAYALALDGVPVWHGFDGTQARHGKMGIVVCMFRPTEMAVVQNALGYALVVQ